MLVDAKRQDCVCFCQMVGMGPQIHFILYNQVVQAWLEEAFLRCVTWCCSLRHQTWLLLLCLSLPVSVVFLMGWRKHQQNQVRWVSLGITAVSKGSIMVVFKCSAGLCEVVSQRRSMRQMWARDRETGTGRQRTVDWQ